MDPSNLLPKMRCPSNDLPFPNFQVPVIKSWAKWKKSPPWYCRPGLGCPKIMPLQKYPGIQKINHSCRKNGGTRGMGPLLIINLQDTTIFPMNHHFGRPVFKNPEGKIQPPLLLLTVTYTTAVLWQMEPYSNDPARGADVFSLSSKPLVKTCLCENRINKKKK